MKQMRMPEVFQVDSTSLDPQLAGPIELSFSEDGLMIRWAGETEWTRAEWHEILWILRKPRPDYRKVLAELKEEAYEEGLNAGVIHSLEAAAVASGKLIIGKGKTH